MLKTGQLTTREQVIVSYLYGNRDGNTTELNRKIDDGRLSSNAFRKTIDRLNRKLNALPRSRLKVVIERQTIWLDAGH